YYRYNKTGDGAWTVYNDDQASWVDVYEQNIDNATPVVLVSYEYLEAREDCYYFAEGERTYKYYFIDGKLSCIEVGGNTNFSIYVNFDVPVIEAPELTVEASEWDLAFENLLDDTVAKTYVVSGTSSTTFVKMDGVSIFINTNDEGEYIYTTDGTNYYCYTRYYRNGVWDDWEVLTVSQTGYQQGYAIYGSLMLNDLVVKNDYNESNYVDGAYVYGDVSYSFENGKLIAYTSQTTTVSFNYDVPVIEIPQNATPRD
ncbi:MAG: hypothetical protein IJ514_07455, partial [Clostridia bacterium]|nr:hypothetical protein [Clostridia bacterium]